MRKSIFTFILTLVLIVAGMIFTGSVNAAPKDKVNIPDTYLRQILADNLNSQNKNKPGWVTKDASSDFTEEELASLKSVDFDRSAQVVNLTGMEYCVNVETIDLEYCYKVADLTPLKNLKKIKDLDIEQIAWDGEGNKATNLNVIAGLTNIETIRINYSNLSDKDVWIFDNMNKIKNIEIGMNDITDPSFLLKHKKSLEIVNLTSTEVSDVSCLTQLDKLKILCISGTHVSDYSFITKLPKLTNDCTRWAQWGEADFNTRTSNEKNLVFGAGDTFTIKNTVKDYNGNLWAPDTTNCSYDASTGNITVKKEDISSFGEIVIKYTATWNYNKQDFVVEYRNTLSFMDINFVNEPQDKTVDEGASITLSARARHTYSYGNTITYQWFKDGQAINGATGDTYTIQSASLNDAGKYYVQANNEYETIISKEATVVVNELEDPEEPAEDPEEPAEDPEEPAEDPEEPAEEPEEPAEEPEENISETVTETSKQEENTFTSPQTGDNIIIFAVVLLVVSVVTFGIIKIRK